MIEDRLTREYDRLFLKFIARPNTPGLGNKLEMMQAAIRILSDDDGYEGEQPPEQEWTP